MAIVLWKKTPLSDLPCAPEVQELKDDSEPAQSMPNENDQSDAMPIFTASSAIDDHAVIDFHALDAGTIPHELTEDAIAEEFAERYEKEFRFDHDLRRWFRWTGSRWAPDHTHAAFDFVRRLCREHRKGDTRLASRKATEGVETMARRDQRLAVTSDIWDRDPLLLGTPNGTVDLTTGLLRPASPGDFITCLTKIVPAPVGTTHPTFSKFLSDATTGDMELQRFLQQWLGYCLTGLTQEHALLFIYGPGGNGKSVLQNVSFEIMHDYAKAATMETLVATRYEAHSTDIAMLHGARLVVASETDKGGAWAEAKINRLTGGDPITARFMRKDNFTFKPQFKLVVIGNHKPHLKTVNDATRRRIKIVPFTHKPAQPDHGLADKLKCEAPAILRWMINGCCDWLKNGLCEPAAIKKATAEYFAEQDILARWIEEQCELHSTYKTKANDLYASWRKYAESLGEDPGNAKTFGALLAQRGFDKTKSSSTIYLGVRLRTDKQ